MERSEDVPATGSVTSARLAELYQRHVGRAIGLARLLSDDPNAAEDIAHEAFIRAAGRITGLRDASAFDAYLRRTVVNLCRARRRREAVERRYLRRAVERKVEPDRGGLEDRDVLWTALGELPERQRAAVVLRYYEDLNEERVAEVLRCSPRAVNSLVSRAMATLRARVGTNERAGDEEEEA
ncbi:MAG TPA: sigma-70 family RNA polymerase sigma factor [Actinomycetota bacterium]|jgi:RNA polymerase sigma factor (sigma-70 family)